RGTAHQRGYTVRWRRVREMKLKIAPLCEKCKREGKVTAAEIVHHIKPISQGGAVTDMGNLMSVCRHCHDVLHGGRHD
ncbi:MAG: HNH endonuclease signature motif containing protein, partial [Eubacteriales bacterium]|nr:HNH endonuclease signature motif containing protein [Eubacteriales bacterium]